MRWQFDDTGIDWNELSELYRIAPLGNKSAEGLSLGFLPMRTARAIFQNQEKAIQGGLVEGP